MYKELNDLISEYEKNYESTSEFWAVDGVEDAIDIISEFEEDDWTLLINELNSKSPLWKTLLVQSLTDSTNDHVLEILNILAKTSDRELFRQVINKLSRYDLDQIDNLEEIEAKINELMPIASESEKMNFNNFLKKNQRPMI